MRPVANSHWHGRPRSRQRALRRRDASSSTAGRCELIATRGEERLRRARRRRGLGDAERGPPRRVASPRSSSCSRSSRPSCRRSSSGSPTRTWDERHELGRATLLHVGRRPHRQRRRRSGCPTSGVALRRRPRLRRHATSGRATATRALARRSSTGSSELGIETVVPGHGPVGRRRRPSRPCATTSRRCSRCPTRCRSASPSSTAPQVGERNLAALRERATKSACVARS